jgi:hypothetical protein
VEHFSDYAAATTIHLFSLIQQINCLLALSMQIYSWETVQMTGAWIQKRVASIQALEEMFVRKSTPVRIPRRSS